MKTLSSSLALMPMLASIAVHAAVTDYTIPPNYPTVSFSPVGIYANDQVVASGSFAHQKYDSEGIGVNYVTQELVLWGGWNFLANYGDNHERMSSILLSDSVITGSFGSNSNGYETMLNTVGFTYALRPDSTATTWDLYKLVSTTELVLPFFGQHKDLGPFDINPSTATLVGSFSANLQAFNDAGLDAALGIPGFVGGSHYLLSLPLAATAGQSVVTYELWCGNKKNVAVVPETIGSRPLATVFACALGWFWVRRMHNASGSKTVA